MIRPYLAILLTLLPTAIAEGADVLRPATPQSASIDADALEAAARLIRDAVEQDDLRGAVLLVARHGKIVLHEALGWRDKERGLPMQRDTLFRMASNTKPVVAAAVLTLADDGMLRLDDPVSRFLPAFAHERSAAIRIDHLLTHTSGMRIPTIFLKPLLTRSAAQPDALSLLLEVNRFAPVGAARPPGTSYSYSNPGYNTLGAIVETVRQQPLEAFLTERFYEPLGMVDTHHASRPALESRMASVYRYRKGQDGAGGWRRAFQPGDPADYPFVRASGGMISTSLDYAVFLQMMLNGGVYAGRKYVDADSVRLAMSPQTRSIYSPKEARERESFYGYGWNVSADGIVSHGGSDGTFAWIDPERSVIGMVLTQSTGRDNPRAKFVAAIRDACRD